MPTRNGGADMDDLSRQLDQANDYLHDIAGTLEAILVILQEERQK